MPVNIGKIKWFDSTKGFGFVLDDAGGGDILLHANVLRDFGLSSVVEGSEIEVETAEGRVKWFDKAKGFGFINIFGSSEDIFLHVEVLRAYGMAELQQGEAIGVKVSSGPRGKMVFEVRPWDYRK